MASYKHLFSIITIIFLFMYSTPTRGSQVALSKSRGALSNQIDKISSVQHLLANLSKIYTKNKSLSVCSEVVNAGNRLLSSVHRRMKGVARYDSDASLSLQTMYSAATTYLRTCGRILKEAKKHNKAKQFGSLRRHLDDIGNNCFLESYTLRAISRATVPRKKPKQESPFHKIHYARDIPRTLRRIPKDRRIVVAQDGTGHFSTISAAIAAAPAGATDYFLIIIKAGRYNEKVVVPIEKPFLVLAGAGKGATIITGSRSYALGYNTWDSATVEIYGHNFIGYNIGFENSAGPQGGQAVAVLCSSNLSAFYKCGFYGFQDTLYAHAWLQFYRECDIYGTIDFILGDASAVFQSCNIVVRPPLLGQSNPIVAQQRECPTGRTGFTIQNCVISPAPGFPINTKTYLGRPWGKSTRVAFISNQFNVMIDPVGWLPWYGIPTQVYLGEFNNTGSGADMAGRVTWPGIKRLTQPEAYNLTVDAMLGGGSWLDRTRVPYVKGLF
ncbi:putative pectinesterase/pectinesterase inhibitor 25 [Carex littledalei]|uniref:pectinesterase n=1 Tax=Carex littledalei TaxID=544730 RepID=A0A833QEY1_9POAL|nr:putative pectinesterase/pectinesterase inhibitor 25 [Carex littledalei]